jgi:hypothetical protein
MSSSECYPDEAADVDLLMDTLSHHHRRAAIHFFENVADGPVASVDELAAHLEDRVPGETADQLETTLYHHHLPLLEDRGWVEYDQRTRDVRYHGDALAAQRLSELVQSLR